MSRVDGNPFGAYRFWAYAAVFGALWGAVEITVGSFLHAIKLPFGSVGLAGVGTILALTLRTVKPARGVVLAAGVTCAGVKLLSPSGAVLGPMIGIVVEAGLIELAMLPLGVRWTSGCIGGSLACLWTVAQKLITQTLFMGPPVIGLYKSIARQAERMLHLPASGGAWVICAFLGTVAAIGVAFGACGVLIGKRTATLLASHPSPYSAPSTVPSYSPSSPAALPETPRRSSNGVQTPLGPTWRRLNRMFQAQHAVNPQTQPQHPMLHSVMLPSPLPSPLPSLLPSPLPSLLPSQ